MSDLILSELVLIKWLLSAILTILVFYTLTAIVRLYKKLRTEIVLGVRERFMSEAHRLEDAGKYDLLSKLANMRINSYPNDPNGYWFLALAKFRNKEWAVALSTFKRIQKIDAAWNKFTIEQYIEDSQSQLSGPTKTIT